MLDYEVLYAKALLKMIELYGMDYMKSKIKGLFVGRQEMESCFRFYYCLENDTDRPDLEADYKGWTVWATLDVDKETGDVKIVECVLPDGSRIGKE